ncbi:metal-dependent transcriptional regulator [Methanospirillum hungatei]|uniref:metal-dependent transcriptional regulator n=1 Tax=Methanospirillum hungatei TaxID=2203 RepID=UPI0026F37564|nr:metal-dependent transcriptional regulator [Methanospirillum hungatei]MCA1916070.1 metal-dependent transcriptional regulator [Methanospirillum hungatei]
MTGRVDTPQKIRFLKFIHAHESGVKPGEIALKFGIRTPTVTRSLHELGEAGYIWYDSEKKVSLTESGEDLTRFFQRRHRILSLMFARAGLSEKDACTQAEKIEHLVPRVHIDQICRSLGHPSRAACGVIDHDPICCGV